MQQKRKIDADGSEYWNRREFMRNDFRLQDRVKDIAGMTIIRIIVDSQSFTMLCRNPENGKYLRVHIAESKFNNYGPALRLTATEIKFKSEEEMKEQIRKEEKKRIKKLVNWVRKKHEAKIQAQS